VGHLAAVLSHELVWKEHICDALGDVAVLGAFARSPLGSERLWLLLLVLLEESVGVEVHYHRGGFHWCAFRKDYEVIPAAVLRNEVQHLLGDSGFGFAEAAKQGLEDISFSLAAADVATVEGENEGVF